MAEIMMLHHQHHHQSYVTNYNQDLLQLQHALSVADSPAIIRLQSSIKFNGEAINYYLPVQKELGGEPPEPSLGSAIETRYGSRDALFQKVSAEGAALQGSGWIWLALDKEQKKLSVETTANQQTLFRYVYLRSSQ